MDKTPKIVLEDPWLEPYSDIIAKRIEAVYNLKNRLTAGTNNLCDFANGHNYYGLRFENNNWIFREWAPNANSIYLTGVFNDWQEKEEYSLNKQDNGNWEIILDESLISDGDLYELSINWNDGNAKRIPSYANYCLQDENTKKFNGCVWAHDKYEWKHDIPNSKIHPVIYEAHVGMATSHEKVGSYQEFAREILPRIKKGGYNTVQLMAIQEHPYYGSFGYHVSNFFAVSSRFGTPNDLKKLIDTAHGMGLRVIMDIVHSHSVKNENEGLGKFDGSEDLYFHSGDRREHVAWDSLCFNYKKEQVLHFLLSNCRYWLEEFKFDGFRFDGVTSMLYYDHGLSRDFSSYDNYFDGGQDGDALSYLALANLLIHEINPNAITIAEEMSGLPGLAEPVENGGLGFDYRMAMGVPDYWIKLIKERADENWDTGEIYRELTSKRANEKTISYAESHDQALVGDKTIIFRLIDKEMYWSMDKSSENLVVDRGIALHKMIRLITFATNGGGYLNFMGNEFGHPEWIDFPREGNNWSFKHARRQWNLVDDDSLRYMLLNNFDIEMLKLHSLYSLNNEPHCNFIQSNEKDQILAFSRGELLFVFNFNPDTSFTDYGFKVSEGKYKIVLHTDRNEFGGFERIDESVLHFTQPESGVGSNNWLNLYLPSRAALVLQHKTTPSVY